MGGGSDARLIGPGDVAPTDGAAPTQEPAQSSWSELPPPARTAAVGVAARVLGALPASQVPTALAPIARFAPAKRARRGAVALGRALESDDAFRAVVALSLPEAFGRDPSDPARALARAFLLRLPIDPSLMGAAVRQGETQALRAEVAALTKTVASLTGRLAAATAGGAAHASGAPDDEAAALRAEVDKLRVRLRSQGTRMREVQDGADAAVAAAAADRDRAVAALDRERAETASWRERAELESHRADAARAALQREQDQATQQRQDADRRIALLLDTVVQAATGLRREWHLAAGGAAPADVVARGLPYPAGADHRPVDAAAIVQWLRLPAAHLIVDGYNVTKAGYPELTLAAQRDRLVRSVAALAARTGCEATVVFDGAAVVVPPSQLRGVRVVFSPAGVIADDVIRDMAQAEPVGRVVVVVSSDREVAEGVRRAGARVASSDTFLRAVA